MVKEILARLSKKFKDFVHLNPEYVGRQFDTAPARFKDMKGTAGEGANAPNVPTLEPGRSKFNIRYFDRDTRRAAPLQEIEIGGSSLKMLEGAEEAAGENALTGLELLPGHLPTPTWQREVEAIQAHAKANGLPPAAGAPHKFATGGSLGGATGFA